LIELDRLAYIVMAIENDAHVCPVGAFKLTPQHELRRDEGFKGIKFNELCSMNSF
jgi:hypothetical protein